MKISESKRQKIGMLWNVVIVIVAFLVLVTVAYKYVNSPKEDFYISDRLYCEKDSDCICGGKDVLGECFVGNKIYYEKFVDKTLTCPDFCTGIAGHLETKCVESRCRVVNALNG